MDSAVLTNGDDLAQIGKFRLVFLTVPTTGGLPESVTGDPRHQHTSTKPEIGSLQSDAVSLDQHQPNVANIWRRVSAGQRHNS